MKLTEYLKDKVLLLLTYGMHGWACHLFAADRLFHG